MKVTQPCVVALSWTLKDTLGELLDESDEPVEFFVGGSDLLAKIEEGLAGHEAGDRVDLHLEPEHAFGDFDDRLIFLEPLARFPEGLEIGMAFEGLPPGCNPDAPADRLYFVSEIYPDHVVLDGNHPLAGMALRLRLRIHAVREPNEEEVGRGSTGTGFFTVQPSAPPGQSLH